MKRSLLAVLAVALTALVAGCGGQTISADEVSGGPVSLKVPEVAKGGADTLARGSSSSTSSADSSSSSDSSTSSDSGTSGTSSATATATATATPQATATAAQGNTTGGTTGTGTTGTSTQQGTGNSQSQTGGQPFNDFCKKNPGAC